MITKFLRGQKISYFNRRVSGILDALKASYPSEQIIKVDNASDRNEQRTKFIVGLTTHNSIEEFEDGAVLAYKAMVHDFQMNDTDFTASDSSAVTTKNLGQAIHETTLDFYKVSQI